MGEYGRYFHHDVTRPFLGSCEADPPWCSGLYCADSSVFTAAARGESGVTEWPHPKIRK